MDGLIIREMQEEDIELVAKFFYDSFWKKMLPLHSLNREEAEELIGSVMLGSESSRDLYHVADLDGQVVGAIKCKTCEDEEEFYISGNKVLLKIGVIKLLKAGILLAAMDSKVNKGHLYIEMVAVDYDQRSKGIGTKLLEYSESMAVDNPQVRYLSLHVVEKNLEAKKLYERYGFRKIRSQWNSVVKGLGGIKKVYFMVKKVSC